jgi:polyferredoxin
MSRRLPVLRSTNLRRIVQILTLAGFFGLVCWARAHTAPGAGASPWLSVFFQLDPFLLITTFLTTHVVIAGLLWSLIVLVLTLVLGRVFCGWLCPLGTIHALAGWVVDRVWPNRTRRDHWSRWQLAKYVLLVGALVLAVLGSHWACLFDPLVLLYRTTATALLPGLQWAVLESTTPAFQSENPTVEKVTRGVIEPVDEFLKTQVWGREDQIYLGAGLILTLFLLLVALNAYRRRWWCRYLCPLGALLGLFARRPLLRRAVPKTCNQCDLCTFSCHGASTSTGSEQWRPSECLVCLNCSDSCHLDSLGFTWAWPWQQQPAVAPVDLSKRTMLASAVGGLAALVALRIGPQARGKLFHADLIRPPGAGAERAFLQRCTGCGLCLEVCPSGGLQPVFLEAGLEGLWTPQLVPRLGACEYECNLCTQVCPTHALTPLTMEEKQKVRIGLATFDTTRCIPYAFGRDCMVCEEHCPIPDKAIFVIEVEVVGREGEKRTIKQPHVDPARCIGCGKCENVCPFKDRPAIRVTSANESRTPANQPILSLESDSPY